MTHCIYLAGPLFTPAERQYLETLTSEIEALGLPTYLPHRDAGVADRERAETRRFYEADLRALDRATLVVAVLNGTDVDSGTAFEIGYAVAKGTPVLALYEDTRIVDPATDFNVMIANACRVFSARDALVAALGEHARRGNER